MSRTERGAEHAHSGGLVIRRPLPALTLAYLAGTAAGLSLPVPPSVSASAAGGCVAGALVLRRGGRRAAATVLMALAFLLTGWAASRRSRVDPLPGSVARAAASGDRPAVTVEGTVTQDPDLGRRVFGRRIERSFCMSVDRLDFGERTYRWRSPLRIRWYSRGRAGLPAYGERWVLHGRLRRHAWGRGDRLSLAVNEADGERLVVAGGIGFAAACLRGRRAAAGRLGIGMSDFPEAVGVTRALLLGYRGQVDAGIREMFAETNALHLFAISGLHVGMVCCMLVFVLGACRVPRMFWAVFLTPALWAYTVATGAKPSAVRACLMAVLYFAAPLVQRKPDPVSAVCAAALLIVAWDPSRLREAGFIFSFATVAGILALYPRLHARLSRAWRRDPHRVGREPILLRIRRVTTRYTVSLLALSLSAWVSSAPLTAYYFGRFSPMAPLTNAALIPLAFLTVLSGCLSVTLGTCLAFAADLFNHASLALVGLLLLIVRAVRAVPFACLNVPRPPLALVVGWYALLAFLLVRRRTGTPAKSIFDSAVGRPHTSRSNIRHQR